MIRSRRAAMMVLFLAVVSACGGPEPVVMAPAPEPSVSTAPEAPVVLPPIESPPVEASAAPAAAADDPIPRGARTPARAPAAGRKPEPTGRIEIPAIGLSHATYEGVELSILNYGPGHWPGTAAPGQRGNTVFPGHRTTFSRPFWDIDRLVPGDQVIFTTPAGRFTYRVDQTMIVDDRANWIVGQTEEATFSIFACHPKGSARQRYVVKGGLVEAATTTTTARATTTSAPPGGGDPLIPGLYP